MSQYATNPQTLEEALEPEKVQVKNWAAFIESEVVNFFNTYKLEKMTLEDGRGNKAKLARTKDNDIKVEYTSSVLL